MKCINVLFCFFLVFNFVSAQISNLGGTSVFDKTDVQSSQMFNSLIKKTSVKTTSESYAKIKGSPYVIDELVEGYVIMNSGVVLDSIMLQIDAYIGEVIVENENGDKMFLNPIFYQQMGYTYKDKDFIFLKVNPEKPEQFYEVLFDGAGLVFFKEYYVTLREGHNNGMHKQDQKFNKRSRYFIKQYGNVDKVKLKKKDILKLFSEAEQVDMNNYIKKHDLKLKSEKDFVALFAELYN